LLKFELNSKFVCVWDPEEHEINFVHYFLHPVCVMDHPSCATGPASQRLAMRGCSWAEVVFLRCAALTRQCAACASQSDSITLAGLVSPRTLNVACLCIKVESITILTESPALNWLCAVFASRRYNAIRCHGRDWRWEHAHTHRSCRRLPCVVTQGSGRGRNTRGAALNSMSSECSGLWLAKYNKWRVNRPADHG